MRLTEITSKGKTIAELIAAYLSARKVQRVYGLCGGHIQPIWDAAACAGITIVDTRHEMAAVLMAQAEAELTGRPGVALVTAGPGLTNAVTGIANAHSSCTPVLVLSGQPPRPQQGWGAMQELPQRAIVQPLCRSADTVPGRHQLLPRLDAAWHAALGDNGPPGPAYLGFPTDLLSELSHPADVAHFDLGTGQPPGTRPDPGDAAAACELIRAARRPLVLAGRGLRGSGRLLSGFLDATGALYLDFPESRGVLPRDHPAAVPAMRGRALKEADLIITLERPLNFQLGYGSPAVFADTARFLRAGTHSGVTSDNRRGDAELRCTAATALAELTRLDCVPRDLDRDWAGKLRQENAKRASALTATMATAPGDADGRMHPYRLITALNRHIDDDTIVVADGGDILSFARVGIPGCTYLDCGPLGCLGVGVPFATAAGLTFPGRRVLALIGDGAFGLSALEISTAARHGANVVFAVANNHAWNIEKQDQLQRYSGHCVGVDLPNCRYDLLAEALGAHGRQVSDPADLEDALNWALRNTPAVLDVLVTQDAESPDFAHGIAQVHARHALTAWHEAEEARYAMPGSVAAASA